MSRVLKVIIVLLTLLDIAVGLMLAIPFYLVIGQPVPSTRETISSVVGRYATNGYKWALIAEWFIDGLFFTLTGKTGHCRYYYLEVLEDQTN